MKVTALAGGVGGAKLADGLYRAPSIDELTIIVNIGDDFEHFGMTICPDLDTVCYSLAGIADPATGWGRSNETYTTLGALEALGAPTWFRLGDLDIATHLERTRLLRSGMSLSAVTAKLCDRWGVSCQVLPVSDDLVPTMVITADSGLLTFQQYFVQLQCQPKVQGFIFQNAESARPAAGVLEAIRSCDLVVLCPSNPWVSLDPILAIPGLREAIQHKPVLAVSPIIRGKALKGPAAKMFTELAITPSALAIAEHYRDILSGIVIDQADEPMEEKLYAMGIKTLVTDTIMQDVSDRIRLAEAMIDFFNLSD